MTRRCTVCDHPERAEIDAALVGATVSYRHIAARYGLASWSNAVRHAAQHIPALLAEAHDAEIAADADTLLEKVGRLEAMALGWHEAATRLRVDAEAIGAPEVEVEPLGAKPTQADRDRYASQTQWAAKLRREALLDRARAIKAGTTAVNSIGGVLELLGKVTGELTEKAQRVELSALVHVSRADESRLEAAVWAVLAAHPDGAALMASLAARLKGGDATVVEALPAGPDGEAERDAGNNESEGDE